MILKFINISLPAFCRNDQGLPKDEITRSYFQLLDKDDILKLYKIYQNDFELFEYDHSSYL